MAHFRREAFDTSNAGSGRPPKQLRQSERQYGILAWLGRLLRTLPHLAQLRPPLYRCDSNCSVAVVSSGNMAITAMSVLSVCALPVDLTALLAAT